MSEKIGPCPNPKCGSTAIVLRPTLGTTTYHGDGDSYSGVRPVCDDCQLAGPWCHDEAAAIAAWNSISMGWINAKDKEPPREDVFGLTEDGRHLMFEYGRYSGDGWSSPESEWDHYDYDNPPPFRYYMPIPPTLEGK